MLPIAAKPVFWTDVEISVKGEEEPAIIKVGFHHLPTSKAIEMRTWTETRVPVELPESAEVTPEFLESLPVLPKGEERPLRARTDYEVNVRLISEWKGVSAPYSAEALRELLENYPRAGLEIYLAWVREHNKSKAKNSKPSRGS